MMIFTGLFQLKIFCDSNSQNSSANPEIPQMTCRLGFFFCSKFSLLPHSSESLCILSLQLVEMGWTVDDVVKGRNMVLGVELMS